MVYDKQELTYVYAELSFYNKAFDLENWDAEIELRCFEKTPQENKQVCHLVFNKKIRGVTGNDWSYHIFPGIYQTIFIQGSLQSLLAEKLPEHIANLFCVIPLHKTPSVRTLLRFPPQTACNRPLSFSRYGPDGHGWYR